MQRPRWNKGRLIVGSGLVIIAALLWLFAEGEYSTAGIIALAVLGLAGIAIAKR